MHPTASPNPLLPSSIVTRIYGAYLSHTQASQKDYLGDPTITQNNNCVIIHHISPKEPVRNNKETNTSFKNCQIRYIGCICVLPKKYWIDLTIESSVQTSLIFQRESRDYNSLDPPKKYLKYIQAMLLLHIYKYTNTHMNTSISQLIACVFFFGMQFCEYFTTTK